jgi:hypothetical protein
MSPPETPSPKTSVLLLNTLGEHVLDFVKAKAHQVFVYSMEIMTGTNRTGVNRSEDDCERCTEE